jgi:prephenate dehydrogenase
MGVRFERVSIIGVGLLGSSLGLGLKARGMVGSVIGVGHHQKSLDVARDLGAIDHTELNTRAAVEDADLIVIATPAGLVTQKLDEIREACSDNAFVTDVASTKAAICKHADATWSPPRRFVGSHPMAGSEKFGPEHGTANFYENSVCLVETGTGIDPDTRQTVVQLWEALGAKVLPIDPDQHDALLASTSHIPHVMSAILALLACENGARSEHIGNGFRDMTRIAASRPEVWRDICLTNRDAVLACLSQQEAYLESFRKSLIAGDATAIEDFFAAGKVAREELIDP